MDEELKSKLEDEKTLGSQAKKLYSNFVKDYCESRRQEIFLRFCEAEVRDQEGLVGLKQLIMVINDFEDSILTTIDTGKLATQSLNEENEEKEDG